MGDGGGCGRLGPKENHPNVSDGLGAPWVGLVSFLPISGVYKGQEGQSFLVLMSRCWWLCGVDDGGAAAGAMAPRDPYLLP